MRVEQLSDQGVTQNVHIHIHPWSDEADVSIIWVDHIIPMQIIKLGHTAGFIVHEVTSPRLMSFISIGE